MATKYLSLMSQIGATVTQRPYLEIKKRGFPLITHVMYSFYPDVAFVRLSRKILQFHNCGVGIPPNNMICVQFPTRCCFQGKYFKSYSHQCHSYRRDIVSMTWLPQFWSGVSPRQHTHVCVQFLSRC